MNGARETSKKYVTMKIIIVFQKIKQDLVFMRTKTFVIGVAFRKRIYLKFMPSRLRERNN